MTARPSAALLALAILWGGAAAAGAQEPPSPVLRGEVADLETCLQAETGNPRSCAGRLADACQAQPDGDTTPGIVACVQQETELWDRLLNARYAAVVALTRESAMEGGPDAVASLREAQRRWIAYRDAECERIYDFWASGTIRNPAHAFCMLRETAGRAIDLDPDQTP